MAQAPQGQSDALNEGRRIYLGNLPYRANPYDIENLLAANGFEQIESVHISVDPVSARNPGYCFVDFPDKATADRALVSLSAEIDGRFVKVGPCEPKKQSNRRFNGESDYAFQRWGDWNSRARNNNNNNNNDNNTASQSGHGIQQGPTGALNHFDAMVKDQKGRRMFVGGLPKMINQAQHNSEIAELFAAVGINPVAIGKRITPAEHTRALPGNQHYCFVDFETKEEMDAALKALRGRLFMGGKLKLAPAREAGPALKDRRLNLGGSRGEPGKDNSRQEISYADYVAGSRAAQSNDWRRRDA